LIHIVLNITPFNHPPSSIHPPGLHGPIVEAVLAGNPDAAAEAMREHAGVFYDNLVKLEKDYRERAEI